MTAERAVMLVKKDLFRGIWLSEQFKYQKKYHVNVIEFLERSIHATNVYLESLSFWVTRHLHNATAERAVILA